MDATLLAYISEHGLLLLQHKTVMNAATLITGQRLSTSWWANPRAQEIFRALEKLDATGDIIGTRLIDRRVTFVHRTLWPAIQAVGSSRAPWQMRGLTHEARKLLARVDIEDRVTATGADARLLQLRLLVHAREEHSATGKHVTVLAPWRALGPFAMPVTTARKLLQDAAIGIGATTKMLPWRLR
jgi:hypothetical protein